MTTRRLVFHVGIPKTGMPHLVERDHDLLGADGRLGQIAGFVAIPIEVTTSGMPRMRAMEQKLMFPID